MNIRHVRVGLGLVAVTALIGVLGVLYAKSSKIDTERKTQVEAYLRQLKQLDAEWNVDVLRSRMELNKNYDPLVNPLPSLTDLQRKLSTEAQAIRDPDNVRTLGQLAEVINDKIDLVDSFKSENAILKNSLRYVPTAVDELRAQIRDARSAGPSYAEKWDSLETRANRILNDVLRYNLFPDAAVAQNIETELAELARQHDAFGATIATSLGNLIIHTRTILRQRLIEDEVLGRLLARPVRDRIDRLGEVFDRDFAAAIDESNRYRNYLLAYASLLLVLLAYFGARLVRSYRIIGRVNKQLTHANETLEQRVRERTEELSQALGNLKESETQLVQSEKMASLGQMVAGVAHEINTPLAYVRSNLETVESHFSESLCAFVQETIKLVNLMRADDASEAEIAQQFGEVTALIEMQGEYDLIGDLRNLLRDGIHGVDQISSIVVNLKNFSRLDRNKVTRCTIDECVDSTLQLARSVVASKRIRKLLGRTAPIRCSPSQINQVLLNLITNAAQATDDKNGVVTVVTRMHDAEHVAVDVIDNGVGIPSDVLPKIFDPFFTTKQVGKGTGLGLSIAYKIVEQHGGSITVHSKEGVGTKFSLVFPTEHAANTPTIDPGSTEPGSIAA